MTSRDYDGSCDWEALYARFHHAARIAPRLRALLGHRSHTRSNAKVIFAGFAQAAADLARIHPVTFVDRAPAVTDAARQSHPALHHAVTADVADVIATRPDPIIILSGRLTAFWQSDAQIAALSRAILAHPRQQIVIDFFDANALSARPEHHFGTPPDVGLWRLHSTQPGCTLSPKLQRVTLDLTYRSAGLTTRARTTRSAARPAALLPWAHSALPGYRARIAPPLIPRDPGFTLHLARP